MKSSLFQPLSPEQRALFHATFLDWLSSARNSELEVLEKALALSPSAGVSRSMLTFIRQSLVSPQMCARLPESLVQLLRDRNWPQAESGVATPSIVS